MVFPPEPPQPQPEQPDQLSPANGAPKIVSPDGTQWYDETSGHWHPVQPDLQTPSSVPPRQRLTRTHYVLIGVAAVVAVAAAAVSAGNAIFRDTRLQDARDACHAGTVGDEGQTLSLDMAGSESGSGLLTAENIACVLDELETPMATISLMDGTRALDGRQTDDWEGLTATWSYHPDNGLDIIIERE